MEQPKKPEKKKAAFGCLLGVGLVILLIIIFSNMHEPDKKQLTPAEARKELIHNAFSGYDGSQNNLVQYVKENMNDPKSFEHVKTTFGDYGKDNITVRMIYRGKNAFGAVVLGSVLATTKDDGTLVSVKNEKDF